MHIEVQGKKEDEFPKRLFQYYCKLFTKHDQSILTLAILTDDNRDWFPKDYQRTVFEWRVLNFNFQSNKLLDYKNQEQALNESTNPFALVVLAHLAFLKAKRKPKARCDMKVNLTYLLYKKGYSRDYVINLLKVLDWILVLPKPLELEYKFKVHQIEEETNMSYVTSFERLAKEEGMQQGREVERYEIAKSSLAAGLPLDVIKKITKLSDLDLLELETA